MPKKLKFPLQISLVSLNRSLDNCDSFFFNNVAGQKSATLLKKKSVSGGADLCTFTKKEHFGVVYDVMRANEFCVIIFENIYIHRPVISEK